MKVLEEVDELLNCLSLSSVAKDRVEDAHCFVQVSAQICSPTHISPEGHLQICYMEQYNKDSTVA